MGAYVNSLLSNGEVVKYETKLHWIIYLFGFILLFAYGIGIIFLILEFLTRKTSEFAVTNKRVVLKTGIISRKALDVQLDKIEGIVVDQGILGRMLNYGTIIVRGTGGASQPFHKIDDPLNFKRMVDEAIEARKGN